MGDSDRRISVTPSPLDGWTKEEKFYLLQGIKAFRSHDIARIHEYIRTKSPQEIIKAINYYKGIAAKHPIFETDPKKLPKKFCKPRVPLTRWARLLTDNLSLEELKTETSTAVRMIAELERMPEPACTENLDFKKIYHTIANAMDGKPLLPDKIVVAVLNKCIVETALSSKAFIKTSSYKYIINAIDLSDKEAHAFPKPTENQELTVLRHLASQRRYNPLRVPEQYMKPSCDAVFDSERELLRDRYSRQIALLKQDNASQMQIDK